MNASKPEEQPDIEFELVEYGAWLFAVEQAGETDSELREPAL